MTIISHKAHDKSLAEELGVETITRVVGYDELGDAIELVYLLKKDEYEWHVGGDYRKDASDDLALQFLNKEQCVIA